MESLGSLLREVVDPWYKSLADPVAAQDATLRTLLSGYARTGYGARHGSEDVSNVEEYRRHFPIVGYAALAPEMEEVRLGHHSALSPEPVVRWVMTRGTTGAPKVLPATQTHLSQILLIGARAVVNFALRTGDPGPLEGSVLNLNFPSEVAAIQTPEGEERYGYSSGTYAKLNPSLGEASLVPKQEEIDALGGGIARSDWERRFELVYERARDLGVKSVMGVTPVILSFARFLRREKGVAPSKVWKMSALFCTSVAKIQTKYAPELTHLYGGAPVVEMYTATEGVFAQQRDHLPYVCPNYDAYLFEVATRSGVKMLHELRPREWGRLVVSTPMLPRYDISDYVESLGKGYFRVLGRANWRTSLEHSLYNMMTFRFV